MPKKSNKSSWGGKQHFRSGNPDDKHYFGHDDRVGGRPEGNNVFGGNRPRVSFKTQFKASKEKQRHLDFEDIAMTVGGNNNGRQVVVRGRGRNNYNTSASRVRGRNSPLPPRMSNKYVVRPAQLNLGEVSWYKVIILYGFKYTKDFVLSTLMSYLAPDTFVPIMYKRTEKEAYFFVDNASTATKLQRLDNQISTNDGFKLKIRVRPGSPVFEINDAFKERLKQAMNKRYSQETNALDLSRFHLDPELADDYFCALNKSPVLQTVLDIVATHIPNLEALNLDGNKLHSIERLNMLKTKLEKLKILYVGDNKIREIGQLDVIRDLKLEELRLAGNPVCNKYRSRNSEYVSAVRKKFPKLLRLDGVELPRPILFDVVDEGVKLPPSRTIFIADPKAQEIANQFLQQYFVIFDSDNRQPLLDAYHEHACFSMTVSSALSTNKSNAYFSENRNLFRINDPNRRRKLIKVGKLPVVSFITTIPRTKHDLNSFTMDLSFVIEGMMLITVTGLFKELDTKDTALRFFNRTFVIVPEGSGYCIRNEQLFIANPSEQQEKRAFTTRPVEIAPPSVPSSSSSYSAPNVPNITGEPMDEIKQNMTLSLSQQTNMNVEWSLKCLAEVQWNFDNALAAFHEFYNRGQIPPEAFKK
ncbi:nuclear RNA export factor 1-like [Leptopilina heterotoma]|uniref:nuclear RNA export factor 1-like n=1 Tax=Leptopilina heterotoma TaxID=63436 RepID=UPI001CAA3FF6|nr:nuclear RNA export factor 1-like [Leptopilina heterotoma]